MDGATGEVYNPPPDFKENRKSSLVLPDSIDGKEFWLIQWPVNQPVDFDGQELTLNFHQDGLSGSFKDSSGKEYMVSSGGEVSDAAVFLSSESESNIVGKISREVAFKHYRTTDELKKQKTDVMQQYQRYGGMMNSSQQFATPSRSRPSFSRSALRGSANSSRHRSAISEVGEPEKSSKRRHADDQGQHTQNSGRTRSTVTFGSSQHSDKGKSKKKIKEER